MSFLSNWITNSLRAGIVFYISNLQVGGWVLLGGRWSLLSNILRFLTSIVLLPEISSLRTQPFEKKGKSLQNKQTNGKKAKSLTHPKSYLQRIAHTFLPNLPPSLNLCNSQIFIVFKMKALLLPQASHDVCAALSPTSSQAMFWTCGQFHSSGFSVNSLFHLKYWLHSSPGYGCLILRASASSSCSLGETSPN